MSEMRKNRISLIQGLRENGGVRVKKELKIWVTVKTVPHPNPQAAIELIANILVNQLLKDEEGREKPVS